MHIDNSYKAVHGQYSTIHLETTIIIFMFLLLVATHDHATILMLMEKNFLNNTNQMHSILKYNIEFII